MDTTCAAIVNEIGLRSNSVGPVGGAINFFLLLNTSGLQYFKYLQTLRMNDLQVSRFSSWPLKLKYIGIFNMDVDSLPRFSDSLITFECWVNGVGFNLPPLLPLPATLNELTVVGLYDNLAVHCPNH